MKVLISILFPLFLVISTIAQEDSTYCFASITNSKGVTVMSEIYQIPKIKSTDLASFKIINSNTFYKTITSLGHQYPVNQQTKSRNNAMVVSNTWEGITVLYDEIQKKSNGKIIVTDQEIFTLIYPSKREVLIRE